MKLIEQGLHTLLWRESNKYSGQLLQIGGFRCSVHWKMSLLSIFQLWILNESVSVQYTASINLDSELTKKMVLTLLEVVTCLRFRVHKYGTSLILNLPFLHLV